MSSLHINIKLGIKIMIESIELTVNGMKCGGCESTVINQLMALTGVISATASSKDALVNIEFDNEQTDIEILKKSITEGGFAVVSL